MKRIKNEIIFDIEEVILDSNFDEPIIKIEEQEPTLPIPPLPEPQKRQRKPSSRSSKKKTRPCIYCQEEIGSYKEMTEHRRTHTDCPLCPKKYASFGCFQVHYAQKHMNIPRKDADKKFACEICGQEFKRKKNIVVHTRRVHNNERSYVCEICNKGFYERTAWEQHKIVHTNEKPFVCELCKKGFKTEQRLTVHMEYHEETRTPSTKTRSEMYMCTYCGKQIRSLAGFIGHQRIHTKELPYECEVCKKKFRTSTSFTSHKRIHTGEKPYKCTICPKRFRMYHFLSNHKLSHGGKNIKKFECQLCGMSTVYKENLDTHMRTVHMQLTTFDCKVCSETFTKITLFKTHMMESHNLLS